MTKVFMATKLGRMVTYLKGFPLSCLAVKTYGLVRSHDKIKLLHLLY